MRRIAVVVIVTIQSWSANFICAPIKVWLVFLCVCVWKTTRFSEDGLFRFIRLSLASITVSSPCWHIRFQLRANTWFARIQETSITFRFYIFFNWARSIIFTFPPPSCRSFFFLFPFPLPRPVPVFLPLHIFCYYPLLSPFLPQTRFEVFLLIPFFFPPFTL